VSTTVNIAVNRWQTLFARHYAREPVPTRSLS